MKIMTMIIIIIKIITIIRTVSILIIRIIIIIIVKMENKLMNLLTSPHCSQPIGFRSHSPNQGPAALP